MQSPVTPPTEAAWSKDLYKDRPIGYKDRPIGRSREIACANRAIEANYDRRRTADKAIDGSVEAIGITGGSS